MAMTPEQQAAIDAAQARVAQKSQQQAPAAPQQSDMRAVGGVGGFVDNIGRRMASGATMGFADEAAAGANASTAFLIDRIAGLFNDNPSLSFGELYDLALQQERGTDQTFGDRFPVTAFAAEATGAVGGALAAGPRALAAAGKYAPAAVEAFGNLPRVVQFGALGAGGGAVSGFGNAEGGTRNRLLGAGIGGTAGAAAGMTIPYAVQLLQTGGRKAADVILAQLAPAAGNTAENASQAALRALAKRLQADQITPQQMIERLQQLGPEASIADAGGASVLGLGRSVGQRPGAPRQIAASFYETRTQGTAPRTFQSMIDNLSEGNPKFYETIDNLQQQRAADAAPLYDAAYQAAPPQDSLIGRLLERPSMKAALQRALSIAKEEGRDPTSMGFEFNEAGDVVYTRELSWQTLDYIKRGLDDVMNAQPRDPATGKIILDEGTRAIDATRRAFVGRLRELNPAYNDALDAWQGPSHYMDTMADGRSFIRQEPEQLSANFARLSENDQEAFRMGAVQELKKIIEGTNDRKGLFDRLYGNEAMRQRLTIVFGDNQEGLSRFVNTLTSEDVMRRNANLANPNSGSQTTPRALDDNELTNELTDAALDLVLNGGIGTGIRRGVNFLRGLREPGQRAAEQLAPVMFSNNQAQNQAVLAALDRLKLRGLPAATGGGVNALAAGSAAGGL